jgi:ribosomal protein S18 acetylase RimI-like enzyme
MQNIEENMIKIERIKINRITVIKPLWEKLNQIHYQDSIYFKDHYKNFTFKKRAEKFIKMNDDDILIETAMEEDSMIAGYCITTISGDKAGEIESIYIEERCRGKKIGERLIKNSLQWLKNKKASTVGLAVCYGHESVFPFYEKFGFYPRTTRLELRELK